MDGYGHLVRTPARAGHLYEGFNCFPERAKTKLAHRPKLAGLTVVVFVRRMHN